MKRVNRREFARMVGGAALVVPFAGSALGEPLVAGLGGTQEAPKKPEPAPAAPVGPSEAQQTEVKAEPKPKLTPEQAEAVKKAIERRDRQLASLRSHTLGYDAEPAFVFRVRQRPRGPKI
jgi:hypothetical protein